MNGQGALAIVVVSVSTAFMAAAGCDSADVDACSRGGELVRVSAGEFCVYGAGSVPPRDPSVPLDGSAVCPRGYPYAIIVGDALVCATEPTEADELPPEVCAALDGRCEDVGDAAPHDAGARDAGGSDGGPIDASRPDGAIGPARGRFAISRYDQAEGETEAYLLDGDELLDLSAALDDALGAADRHEDQGLSISADGTTLALATARAPCTGPCIATSPIDRPTELTPVEDGRGGYAIGDDPVLAGGVLAYGTAGVGAHAFDVYAVLREGGTPSIVDLSNGGPWVHNRIPHISRDGVWVLFECGDLPYDDHGICEVAIDGATPPTVRRLLDPGGGPAGAVSPSLEEPSYANDGSVLLVADWSARRAVWQWHEGAGDAVRVTDADGEEWSPCALPDGAVAMMYRPDPSRPERSLRVWRDGELEGETSLAPIHQDDDRYIVWMRGCWR